jgi:Protein of unknown function (DUF3800)
MFLIYVDESGDSGLVRSPTRYFILTGLVIHELRWRAYLDQIISFRQRMRDEFGLRMREEVHAASMLTRPGALVRIKRHDRLTIIRHFTNELAKMADLNIINVVVDKHDKPEEYDPFVMAWKVLTQRFENTMSYRNFPGPVNQDERGMIVADHTDDKKLMQLLRQMRRYNPIPNQPTFGLGYRDMPLTLLVEDPSFRSSQHSYFVQAADLAAFLLYQRLVPSDYMRSRSGHNYFRRLSPVLCKVASATDPDGIVWL